MSFDYSEPREHRLYKVVKPLSRTVVGLLYDFRKYGTENIPQNGGFLLAANHMSLMDPIIITAACTRELFFMAKSELFKNSLFSKVLENLGAFPVKRGSNDKRSVEFAQRVIEKGWGLGIFPQGKRTDDMSLQNIKSGAAYIVKKTETNVLPVSIKKEKGKFLRPVLTLRFGKVMKYEDFDLENDYSRQNVRSAARKIMGEIIRLYNTAGEENGN